MYLRVFALLSSFLFLFTFSGFGLCVMLDTSKEKYSFPLFLPTLFLPFPVFPYENIRFLEDLNTNAHECICLVASFTVFFISSLVMSFIKFPFKNVFH